MALPLKVLCVAALISVCLAKKRHSVLMIAVDDLRTQVCISLFLFLFLY